MHIFIVASATCWRTWVMCLKYVLMPHFSVFEHLSVLILNVILITSCARHSRSWHSWDYMRNCRPSTYHCLFLNNCKEPDIDAKMFYSFVLFVVPRVDEDEEIIVKAMTDYWVVGKKSDQRELYVILNQKNANLIEVNGKSQLLNGKKAVVTETPNKSLKPS